jgi:hypothetical protein
MHMQQRLHTFSTFNPGQTSTGSPAAREETVKPSAGFGTFLCATPADEVTQEVSQTMCSG